jgi:dynein intermediate chain 3, axonemal
VPWTPLFRMNVKRLEGVGELSLCKLLGGLARSGQGGGGRGRRTLAKRASPGRNAADWRPKANTSAGKDGKEDDDEGNDVPEYVQWMAKDHNRPCVALCRSPFFGDMILSVGDWNFHIWKMDDFTVRQTPEGRQKQPIFTSPDANT